MIRWFAAFGVGGVLAVSAHAACDPAGEVLLNELMPNPGAAVNPNGNSDEGYEWVELYNSGAVAVSLEGWTVEAANRVSEGLDNPGDYGVLFEVPAEVVLEPGAWLVLGGPDAVFSEDIDWISMPLGRDTSLSMGNASASSDAVRLVSCDGEVRDVIAYGTNTSDGEFLDEELEAIIEEKLAPKPSDDRSLARVPDGTDSNNPAQDFVRASPSTPGIANGSEGASAGCSAVVEGGAVVLNEVMANPGAAVNPEGNSDDGYEWVELYNTTDGALNLEGWTLEQAGAPEHWGSRVRFTFPAASVLEPGGFLVIAESLVTFADDLEVDVYRLEEGDDLGMGNSEDAVRLVGCGGFAVDEVVYGGSNADGFTDADGVLLEDISIAPKLVDDQSLVRRADGYDSDDSGYDFTLTDLTTPGEPNPDLRCKTTAGGVVINEFLANPSGTDSQALSEWVELYNQTDEPLDISTWIIAKASKLDDNNAPDDRTLSSLPPGSVIEAGGYFVVGAVLADGANHYELDFDLYSGTSGDAVLLFDCESRLADTVNYGGENEDGLPEDSGRVLPNLVNKPGDDQCVARRIDGVDSNDSFEDFVTTSYCSLGQTNERASTPDTGGTGVPSGGCNGGPRDVRPVDVDPDGGCAVASSGPHGTWGWLGMFAGLLVGARRRR